MVTNAKAEDRFLLFGNRWLGIGIGMDRRFRDCLANRKRSLRDNGFGEALA